MKSIIARALFLLTICGAIPASAVPNYNIVPLGLTGTEHTRNDDYKYSYPVQLNEAGQVSGYSERYNGGSNWLGQSAWLYDGATTVDVGLTGTEHTRDDDFKYSYPYQLNEAGQVNGTSNRYNGGSAFLGASAWLYDGATTVDIGLTGTEHTRDDDFKYSLSSQMNEAGQVNGTSGRYNGGSTSLGQSAWLYDGATTVDIGLTGTEHTRNDDYKYSYPVQLNEAGQVSGYSERYNGGSNWLGQSAWLYDGATTVDVGLTGTEHTRNDDYKYSYPYQLNEAGQVSGTSERYNGGSNVLGYSAWLYDGATTVDIGLTGAEHTRDDDYKFSFPYELNEAGQVSGTSERYNGGSNWLGSSAWLYDGTTTVDIGLTGTEYTRDDDYKYSYPVQLNEAGQVSGYSERYNGGSNVLGYSAWLYDGATTVDIGLTGTEHTRDDDYKVSFPYDLNEAGQVNGTSERYNGGSALLGQSAWLYDGATTVDVGLTGSEHTGAGDYKYSLPYDLNEAGQVSGYSERYNGGSNVLGYSAWLYDGATTVEIGLTGTEHTRDDDYKVSFPYYLNEAGQVSGTSERYNGGSTSLGQSAWLYDPALGQTFEFELSTRSDGYAYSNVGYLGEDGLALGRYELFDDFDNSLGSRAFYFTIADGLHDLGSLVDGGLTANGWDWLADAIRANGLGQILGWGKITSQSGGQLAYLLTPVVPEPSTVVLGVLAGVGLLGVRRRRVPKLVKP